MYNKILIGIVAGSDSDLPVMQETAQILDKFGIGYEINIISAHRTPQKAHQYCWCRKSCPPARCDCFIDIASCYRSSHANR